MNRNRALFSLTLLLACDVRTPVGQEASRGFSDDYLTLPVPAAGASGTIVRVNEGQHEIVHFALTRDHVYFAARWEGIYRVAKTGGPVEVVWADGQLSVGTMGSFDGDVYWSRSSFADEMPGARFERQRPGSAPQPILAANWGVGRGVGQSALPIDASGIYVVAHDRGSLVQSVRRIPLDGGPPRELVTLRPGGEQESWVVDDTHLYLCRCLYQASECEVEAVPKDGGAAALVARLPRVEGERFTLAANDVSHLYLQSHRHLVKLAKTGGALVTLFAPAPRGGIDELLVLDERMIYFHEYDGTTTYPRALPKDGGAPHAIADGAAVGRGTWRMLADDRHVYFLRNGRDLVAHSKTMAPPSGL